MRVISNIELATSVVCANSLMIAALFKSNKEVLHASNLLPTILMAQIPMVKITPFLGAALSKKILDIAADRVDILLTNIIRLAHVVIEIVPL